METALLEALGLSKAESATYLSLVRLGAVFSRQIVEDTGLRKSTVYESLQRLQDRGLVSFSLEKKTRIFEAAPPERLLEFLDEERRLVDKKKATAQQLVEELAKLPAPPSYAETKTFIGIEGFKTMRRDVLAHADGEHLLIGAISKESEVIPGFFEEWNAERVKRGIGMRILHKESARTKRMSNARYMGGLFSTRFLPSEVENPVVINIYGDRVVHVLWNDKRPLCFMMVNREIADAYRKYFGILWKQSGKR